MGMSLLESSIAIRFSSGPPRSMAEGRRRLECEGLPRPSPNSSSIQCTPHVPEEIHVGFSSIFILHAFSITTLAWTVDLCPMDHIQWPWCFQPMDHGATSMKTYDGHRGEPRAPIFVRRILGTTDP